jgi:hypothetical protein
MHWTGILNLISLTLATAVAGYLWMGASWHWYTAILLWPVIYIGLPVVIGLFQGIPIHRERKAAEEKLRRGEPLDF